VKFLGETAAVSAVKAETARVEAKPAGPNAAQRIGVIKTVKVRKEKCEVPITTVKLVQPKPRAVLAVKRIA